MRFFFHSPWILVSWVHEGFIYSENKWALILVTVEIDLMYPNLSTTEKTSNRHRNEKVPIFSKWWEMIKKNISAKRKTKQNKNPQMNGSPRRCSAGEGGARRIPRIPLGYLHAGAGGQDSGDRRFHPGILTPPLFVLFRFCVPYVPARLAGSLRCCLYLRGQIHSYDNSIHTLTVLIVYSPNPSVFAWPTLKIILLSQRNN